MLKTMKIFTKRLELTNFKAEYAEEFTRVLSDPKIFLFLPESVPTINDIENLIQWFIERDLKNAKNGFFETLQRISETSSWFKTFLGVLPRDTRRIFSAKNLKRLE